MKCFMPVYALALALAVTSDMVQQVKATDCLATDVCTGTSCTAVTTGKTAVPLTRPATSVLAACASNKFAYIKSLIIVPDVGTVGTANTATLATDIQVTYSKDGTDPTTSLAPDADPACTNTYSTVGADATANVKASIVCPSSAPNCKYNYKVEWACQAPDSCAKDATTNCVGCAADQAPIATSASVAGTKELARTGDACPGGKFAYLKSLTLGADKTTAPAKIAVTFTGASGLTATKTLTTCDGTWANVGKDATLTANVKVNVACSDTAAACDYKWVGVWECQTAAPDSCAKDAATNCVGCAADQAPIATSASVAGKKDLTRTGDACPDGKFAYLKSLTVGADKTTATDKIAVTFTNGAAALTTTKTTTTCDGTWANVGKDATLTANVKATVACSDTAAACDYKWVGVWECQTAASTSGSSTGNTSNTTAPSVTPTPTPTTTKSGVAALASANPVVVWGTALVAAVAGAYFAPPL